MAQQITLVSDLSGKPIEEGGGTLTFGLQGKEFEIDLTAEEQEKFHTALEPFVAVSRRASSSSRSAKASKATSKEELLAVREWAKANGFSVSERGRIASKVFKAFEEAKAKPAEVAEVDAEAKAKPAPAKK